MRSDRRSLKRNYSSCKYTLFHPLTKTSNFWAEVGLMFLNILWISALNVLQNATALIYDHFLYIIVSIECIRRQQDSKNRAF